MESLDSKVVGELRELMGSDYLTVYDAFIRTANSNMDKLSIAVEQNKLSDVEALTHSLKGSSANIGAVKLSHICKSIMESVRKNEDVDLHGGLRDVLEEYKKVTELIQGLTT